MELLTSKKFKLPTLYYITDREEIKDIPVGVPFMYGAEEDKEYVIRLLEYEILYQKALSSGYPFNFRQILKDEGYSDLKEFWYSHPVYIECLTEGICDISDIDLSETVKAGSSDGKLKDFIRDAVAIVDIKKLKDLNVFPVWVDAVEKAIEINIHNFAMYNPNMYNKKLEGMYGGVEFSSPNRNLIIIDISGSIPKGVSSTCLTMAKGMAESFYADLLITGSKSTLYPYENIHELNVDSVYDDNGMDNDQVYFRKLLESEEKCYDTVIVFGDNHSPSQRWSNEYNSGVSSISIDDGKKLCKWKVNKLISFHTGNTSKEVAGYGLWFTPKEIEHIKDWVKYLN